MNSLDVGADVAIARTASAPLTTELWVPAADVQNPEISIVVPALNEEITIAEFVQWCHQGLRDANVVGEILIVDSSSDQTPHLALANGARVLRTPKQGLGRAYIDALPYIRGKFMVMGDCDLTYDFRELKPFVDAYRTGAEFVMGSRFKGSIEADAMPRLRLIQALTTGVDHIMALPNLPPNVMISFDGEVKVISEGNWRRFAG